MKIKTMILILLVLFLLGLGGIYIFENYQPPKPVPPEKENPKEEPSVTAHFTCPNNAFIDAKFYNKENNSSVDITISDGRNFVLPQTISASGARYANADESLVFWNKGDSAFITENGAITFNDCYTKEENSESNNPNLTQ